MAGYVPDFTDIRMMSSPPYGNHGRRMHDWCLTADCMGPRIEGSTLCWLHHFWLNCPPLRTMYLI